MYNIKDGDIEYSIVEIMGDVGFWVGVGVFFMDLVLLLLGDEERESVVVFMED